MVEMVLVIAILALVGGVAGFLSFTASKKEEFNAACSALQRRLQFAEELMMLGTDLEVSFKKEGPKFLVVIEPDRAMNPTTAKLLEIDSPIYGIEEIYFKTLPMDKIKFNYLSKGFQRPEGELIVRGKYGEAVLKLGNNETDFFSEDLYPHEVLLNSKA